AAGSRGTALPSRHARTARESRTTRAATAQESRTTKHHQQDRPSRPRPRSGECPVRTLVAALAIVALVLPSTTAQDKQAPPKKKAAEKKPPAPPVPPTAANYHYGPHGRQVFDFWQARAETPTPLVLLIHGGGWRGGGKSGYYGSVKRYLD